MKHPSRIIDLLAGTLVCISASAQIPAANNSAKVRTGVQKYVELVSRNDVLKNSVFGVLGITKRGDTLAAWNPGTRMLPASNMKLITTGAGLYRLGAAFKYTTRIGYSGKIKYGALHGNLYILGGGDPTIASKDSIAVPYDSLFSQWRSFLDKVGIRKIDGHVIGDGRYFDGPIEKDTWSYQDIGTAYGTGGDGLCFYENAQDFAVSAGLAAGEPVKASVLFPYTPWVEYTNVSKTSESGSGDQLFLYDSDVYPYAELRGSFAIDRNPKTEEFSNKFGAYTCAHYFCDYLKSNGIKVTKGPADVRMGHIRSDLYSLDLGDYASKADDLEIIGSTYSAPLVKIVRETNMESDNFYAETIFRTLGRMDRHSASYDSSYLAVGNLLRKIGTDPSDVQIMDGSGLSRHNYVSPAYFVDFLSAMMDTPVFGEYVGTLGRPGDRHYESRLRGEKSAVRSRIHMKSGSMNGVRCFSGYIEPAGGNEEDTIIFSVMTNNVIASSGKVDQILDKIIALLAAENQ